MGVFGMCVCVFCVNNVIVSTVVIGWSVLVFLPKQKILIVQYKPHIIIIIKIRLQFVLDIFQQHPTAGCG